MDSSSNFKECRLSLCALKVFVPRVFYVLRLSGSWDYFEDRIQSRLERQRGCRAFQAIDGNSDMQ